MVGTTLRTQIRQHRITGDEKDYNDEHHLQMRIYPTIFTLRGGNDRL